MIKITGKEFFELAELVEERFGIHLKEEKKALVEGRLFSVLQSGEYSSFSHYIEKVRQDRTGNLLTTLVERITTNHTYFLREKEHFDFLREIVLPHLNKTLKDRDIRIWSAGCSTGEEPYSIVMTLSDYLGFDKDRWEYKILATDISKRVLEYAWNGVYFDEALANVPDKWKKLYFSKIDELYIKVSDEVKAQVLFRNLNLKSSSFPFKRKFHVIFCRNVMIYFDRQMKKEVIENFYKFLEPGGYLFIGHSETINDINPGFEYIRPAIYRKRM
ncbi:MAG: protein-glutamate O-methyltransferase CheR [Clostridia bacterium]|nr:protein-glutamate O-methyltransferase CheR [Clostridia bacterium]